MIFKNLKKRIFTSLILLFLIFLIMNFNFILVYSLIIIGIVSCLEFFSINKKIIKNQYYLLTCNLLFTFYVFLFCLLFFFFSNILQLKIILFTLLFSCIASDIGGFIFGKIFKGPKLTKISPNKTISGALGSLIFSCITIACIFYYIENLNINIFFIGLTTSIFCQSGDLFFSFLKRKAKIKDTGNFLPGHGGVLDRVDGILLGIPLGFIALTSLY
jgi:phosphatidate cytidylyltransferase